MLVKFDLGNTNVVFSLDDENKENKNIREIFEGMRLTRNTHNLFLYFSLLPLNQNGFGYYLKSISNMCKR